MKGWEQKPLLDCVELLQGVTYSSANVKPYGLLVLRSSNIKNGMLTFDDCVYVNCDIDKEKHVQKNDILICVRNGSKALIGKSCVVDKNYNATFGAFMSVLRGDQTGYYAYITALEKLIAKKQLIKQGVMQELLTGKRRLPGFGGKWTQRPLSDFGHCVRGVSYNPDKDLYTYEHEKSCVLLRANNIIDEKIAFQNVQYVRQAMVSEEQFLTDGDIVIAMSSGSVIAIGKSAVFTGLPYHYCVGAFCAIFRSEQNNYIRFLFQSSLYRQMLSTFLEGTSINNLNGAIIENLTFYFPSTNKEISAIAEVLFDMDAEIDALTAKLNKAREIKQGMMSELLTGRIRLIDTEPNKSASEAYPKAETNPTHITDKQPAVKGHNQQFDDAVMIAGIVNELYNEKYPLGRKKVQKCLYLLRRYQNENTEAFKKKAAGPYADEVRYKGGEPIAKKSGYINTKTNKQGTIFACGKNISHALGYIETWGRQDDIKWVSDNLRFKKVDELELLATVDMASCDLKNDDIPVNLQTIKHLIETNKEWKAKLDKPIFSDTNIERAIRELQTLFKGGN